MAKRRKKSRPSPWLWLLGAAAGAAAVYFLWHPGSRSDAIPVSGQAPEPAPAAPKTHPPHEAITDSDRQGLDRVLRERAKQPPK